MSQITRRIAARPTPKLIAAVMCALALAVAGCGGGDSYKSKVEAAAKQFKKTSEAAGQKLRASKNKQEFAAGVADFQGAVKTFNAKLQSLNPPDKAKAAQSQLINTLNTFSTDVGGVRDALNTNNVSKIQELQGKVVADIGSVQSAAKELQDKAD
jgi:hypothetical protein